MPGSAAARTPIAGMDHGAEITLEEASATGQASRMHIKEDLRRMRCAVLLCLLAVLLLALTSRVRACCLLQLCWVFASGLPVFPMK